MIARPIARRIPTSPRYIRVEVGLNGGTDELCFKGPVFSVAGILGRLLSLLSEGGDVLTAAQNMDIGGAILGACWYHEVSDLESTRPGRTATLDDWLVYGEAVQDELMEYGHTLEGLSIAYAAVLPLITQVLGIQQAAAERADFSSGAPDSDPPPVEAPQTQRGPDDSTTSPPSSA